MNAPDPAIAFEQARRRLIIGVVVALSVLAAIWHAGVRPSLLADSAGLDNAGSILGGFGSPDLSGAYLERIFDLAIESLLIGLLGMGLALIIGVVLALGAARFPDLLEAPTPPVSASVARRILRAVSRGVLAFFRAVPEIVWAFLFVRIFGLGPGPAVFAIGLTFGGIIGKLYAELIEAVDPEPARRLRAAGAGQWAVFLYGVYPLVRSQWIGYALFRLECAIRSASILGVVGAGGLGYEIDLSIRYFQYDKLATTLLAVLAYVVVLEIASKYLRRASARWTSLLFGVGAIAAVVMLDIPWGDLTASESLSQGWSFVAGFANPNLSGGFVWTAVELTVATVAMAWCATIVAAAIAMILAPMAASTFTVTGFLANPPGRFRISLPGLIVFGLARFTLQITRAFPELVWALIFVVWVGPGATAGVLAVCVHTIGILGRLYGEVLEELDPQHARALESAGASRTARYLYGALPQVAPRLLAFTLFRFEVNIRLTAMVGFVGAGGLGDALHTSISLFHMRDMATLILVLLATVLLVDYLGDRVRSALLRRA